MPDNIVNSRIKLAMKSASDWTTANPTLLSGEVGLDSTNKLIYVGDGSSEFSELTAWNSLPANHVTTDTDQDITGTKTFVGQKKVLFKQSTTNDKLGFTLYTNTGVEKGYLEFNPTTKVDNYPLMTLGNYASSASGLTQVGFRRYSGVSGQSGAYNLLTPMVSDARTPFSLTTTYTNFYLPLGFTDGTTVVKTAKSGMVDLSSLIPTIPTLADVATSGDYGDLINTPTIPTALADLSADSTHRVVTDTEKSTWNNKSDFSGSYNDLTDKPTIPAEQIQSNWTQTTTTAKDYIKNKPTLGTASAKNVPTSGNASTSQVVMGNDTRLSDSRPASDVSAWAKASTKPTYSYSEITGTPTLATVATSGSYNDLDNKPTIPTVNNAKLTITQNSVSIGTFTANQSSNVTVALTDTTYTGTGLISISSGNVISTTAEVNQNAFSNVKVGSTTIQADSKTDTFEVAAGANVILTPDATNDKVTISSLENAYPTATGDTAGRWTVEIPGITEIYDGLTIRIYLSKSYNSTFNTLNVNGLGEVLVKYRSGSQLTSHIPQYGVITLTYKTGLSAYSVSNAYCDPVNNAHYTGSWTANKAYSVGDTVTYSSKYYICKTAHTSGSSWSSSNWNASTTPYSSLAVSTSATTSITDGWLLQTSYADGNTLSTPDYYFRPYSGAYPIYRYKLLVQNKDNKLLPLTLTNQEDTTQVVKTPLSDPFRPRNIWFYNSTTTINANAVSTSQALYTDAYGAYSGYTFNQNVPAYQMIYLKGTYNSETDLFTLYIDENDTNKRSWYVYVPTNTNNINLSSYFTTGYYYILVGGSNASSNQFQLFQVNTMFYFDGTNLVQADMNVREFSEINSNISILDNTMQSSVSSLSTELDTYKSTANAQIAQNTNAIDTVSSDLSSLDDKYDGITQDIQDDLTALENGDVALNTAFRQSAQNGVYEGLLYYDNGTPVYGTAVGQLNFTTENGNKVIDRTGFYMIYSGSSGAAIYQDTTLIAYARNGKWNSGDSEGQSQTFGRYIVEDDPSDGLVFKWGG